MRVRSKWQKANTSLEDNASALAYIIWQIALEQTKNLHREDFEYSDDPQRTGVLEEYLIFLVHISDRYAHTLLGAEERVQFITGLAKGTARHFQRNMEDVYGRNQIYGADYITKLNQRIAEYSELSFGDGEASYPMLRLLGRKIQDIMGETQTNRWTIDQVMDVDGKVAVTELKKGLDNLFGTSTILDGLRAPD